MIFFDAIVNWFGDQFLRFCERNLDKKLDGVGRAMVRVAKKKAPVDTGELREGISYTYRKRQKELTLVTQAPHSLFLEFGTIHFKAHPYLRPALAYGAKLLGTTSVNMGMLFKRTPRLKGHVARPKTATHHANQAYNRATSTKFNRGRAGNARQYIRSYKGGPTS